jgi:hypothetical protein
MARPRAWAVVRFMISSHGLGGSPDRSAGVAPMTSGSREQAARRHHAGVLAREAMSAPAPRGFLRYCATKPWPVPLLSS